MQEYGIPLLVDQKSFLCISVTVGESMQWKKRSNKELPSGNFSRSRAHEWRPAGKFQRQVRIVQGVCIVKVRFWRPPGHQGLRHYQPHTIEGRGNCHSTLYSGVADGPCDLSLTMTPDIAWFKAFASSWWVVLWRCPRNMGPKVNDQNHGRTEWLHVEALYLQLMAS